ncbi:15716_t:CDS:2 [Dentiscutata erythropus]|uniref:15716_t:CDS:1 n=1 Tax=Dentiscutata erythropus TaxID=1348616 RepID=A0A9N9EQK8_9GLOM|nr:15716_t:CDS:2 [Dentiscutata erythropus]
MQSYVNFWVERSKQIRKSKRKRTVAVQMKNEILPIKTIGNIESLMSNDKDESKDDLEVKIGIDNDNNNMNDDVKLMLMLKQR